MMDITPFSFALAKYRQRNMEATIQYETEYRPLYDAWRAGASRDPIDAMWDRTNGLEMASNEALERAIDTRVETLSELRNKIDLLDEVGAFDDANEWFRSLAADIRRLAAH